MSERFCTEASVDLGQSPLAAEIHTARSSCFGDCGYEKEERQVKIRNTIVIRIVWDCPSIRGVDRCSCCVFTLLPEYPLKKFLFNVSLLLLRK
jgi:hypothetical protein